MTNNSWMGEQKGGCSYNWLLVPMKELNFRCMQQYVFISKRITLSESHQEKWVHAVWFSLNKILENAN